MNLTIEVAQASRYDVDFLYTGVLTLRSRSVNAQPAALGINIPSTANPAETIRWRNWLY